MLPNYFSTSPIIKRLTSILVCDLTAVKWLMGWASILSGVGFLFLSTELPAYNTLRILEPMWLWGLAFLTFGFFRLKSCLVRRPAYRKIIGPVIGMYLWSYLLVSIIIFDKTPLEATELLLVLPLLCELWIFTQAIAKHNTKYNRRATDA